MKAVCSKKYPVIAALGGVLFFQAHVLADSDVETYNGNRYQRIDDNLTQSQASAACESRGAHLVTITSPGENNFVFDNLYTGGDLWIGATQPDDQSSPEDGWEWETGESWSFTAWADGEPNDDTGSESNDENCAHLWDDPLGTWNDQECGDEHRYICEWEGPSEFQAVPVMAPWMLGALAALVSGFAGFTLRRRARRG